MSSQQPQPARLPSGGLPSFEDRPPVTDIGSESRALVLSPAALKVLRTHLFELAQRSHAHIGCPDGVGATLVVGGGGSVFAGSNSFTDSIDEVQYGLPQGPCLSAVESQTIIRSRTVGTGELRWERFSPRAATLELRSVTSIPLWADREVIGSLNLYGREVTTFDTVDTSALLHHAERVGRALLSAWLVAVASTTAEILTGAVRDRDDIELAAGLLMDRYIMTVGQAQILIGQLAVHDQVTKADAARSLLNGPQPPAHRTDRD